MTESELKVLLDAASLAKIDPSRLKPVNPWSQQGPTAQSLQVAVQEISATQAARWRNEAGESVSLAAAAAQAGLSPITPAVHNELNELSADYISGQLEAKARLEAETLDRMAAAANELAEKREKQQQAFSRSAGNNNSGGGYNRDFLRRVGVQNAAQLNQIPARRMLGQ